MFFFLHFPRPASFSPNRLGQSHQTHERVRRGGVCRDRGPPPWPSIRARPDGHGALLTGYAPPRATLRVGTGRGRARHRVRRTGGWHGRALVRRRGVRARSHDGHHHRCRVSEARDQPTEAAARVLYVDCSAWWKPPLTTTSTCASSSTIGCTGVNRRARASARASETSYSDRSPVRQICWTSKPRYILANDLGALIGTISDVQLLCI